MNKLYCLLLLPVPIPTASICFCLGMSSLCCLGQNISFTVTTSATCLQTLVAHCHTSPATTSCLNFQTQFGFRFDNKRTVAFTRNEVRSRQVAQAPVRKCLSYTHSSLGTRAQTWPHCVRASCCMSSTLKQTFVSFTLAGNCWPDRKKWMVREFATAMRITTWHLEFGRPCWILSLLPASSLLFKQGFYWFWCRYVHFKHGVTRKVNLYPNQIPPGTSLVFATRYPRGKDTAFAKTAKKGLCLRQTCLSSSACITQYCVPSPAFASIFSRNHLSHQTLVQMAGKIHDQSAMGKQPAGTMHDCEVFRLWRDFYLAAKSCILKPCRKSWTAQQENCFGLAASTCTSRWQTQVLNHFNTFFNILFFSCRTSPYAMCKLWILQHHSQRCSS